MTVPAPPVPPGQSATMVCRPRWATDATTAGVARARWAASALPAIDGAFLVAAVVVARVPWPLAAAYVAAVLVALAGAGQHRVRICMRLGDELPRLLACTLGPLLPLALLRLPILPLAPVAAGLVLASRASHHGLLAVGRRRGLVQEPTLVVGADATGVRVAEVLDAHPELGLSPLGFVDSQAPAGATGFPVLGEVAALPKIVATYRIRRVVVCFPDAPDMALVRVLRGLPADVCVVPRLHNLGLRVPVGCLDEVWGIPLIPLRRAGRAGRAAKRGVDLVAGTVLLVALSPLIVGLALVVRLCSGQPALFRQERITASGRRVTVLKLRTIAGDDDGNTRWAIDPAQYLRFGAFLRATHLDELPQLVNVVRGDMSLVGPRPERPFFTELFGERIPDYSERHRMPAGMTGWAQVHGLHGDTPIEERIRFDNQYIEYWSPWRDLVILARTLTKLFPDRTGGHR